MSIGGSPPSILLADGNESSRQLFGSFFEGRGWKYDVVPDSSSMVGALERKTYDLIIADVELAGPNSVQVLTDILDRHPFQAVIAVSPNASYEDALKLFRCGATDLLARPVDFGWLERVVEQVVFSRRNDEREKASYQFVTREQVDMRFRAVDLAELPSMTLPLVGRLVESDLLTQSEALKIRLAVQEAILNGFEHGNLELDSRWKEEITRSGRDKFSLVRKLRLADPQYANREVQVKLLIEGSALKITVTDEGKGFLNAQCISEGGRVDGLACSGRGLALMSSSVDEVQFGKNGSVVTMIKKLSQRKGMEAYGS